MHLSIQHIHALPTEDFNNQIASCLNQIQLYTINDKRKRRIVKMTVFSSCQRQRRLFIKEEIIDRDTL